MLKVELRGHINWVCMMQLLLLPLLVLIFSSPHAVFCGNIVKTLPGYDGVLPFSLETGYITVNESELFYYFIKSEGNPAGDPVMLWYSGGPGCSCLNGLFYQIGPLEFNITDYLGGTPPLRYYPYSWTKAASILFVDAPVGTGFSYATNYMTAYPTSDIRSAEQVYLFILKWFKDHPEYLKNQFFVGADSYSGISAPIVVQHIVMGNDAGVVPRLNLKGYILGCPRTDAILTENSKIVYSHRMGLISNELYEDTKITCNGTYYEVYPNEPECYENLEKVAKLIHDINKNNILEPKCTWASPEEEIDGEYSDRMRSLLQEESGTLILHPLSPSRSAPEMYWCHNFNYSLSYVWANDHSVRQALFVREGTVTDWRRCNRSLDYDRNVNSVIDVHGNLSAYGLQALVFNGDHDLTVPNLATSGWIKLLNLSVVSDWRPWLVDGEIGGYTIKYSKTGYRLTYATVLGAGHSPQEYKRRECYEMFQRFIHWYPL